MKHLLLVITTLLFVHVSAKADNTPKTVNVPIEVAFIPQGFDDNDRSQLAIIGTFMNTCYRVGPYALKVDGNTIRVQQQAYMYEGNCIQMNVPYHQIVNIGILKVGDYKLVDNMTNKTIGNINVTASKNAGPDDFLYAPITDAYVVHETSDSAKNILVMTGTFADRCSEFEDIQVIYQKNVLVVQPVIKRIPNMNCMPVNTKFLKLVNLKEDVHGVHLLHVRSLNGQAVNKLVELE